MKAMVSSDARHRKLLTPMPPPPLPSLGPLSPPPNRSIPPGPKTLSRS